MQVVRLAQKQKKKERNNKKREMYGQREKKHGMVDILPAKGRLLARRSGTLRRTQGFHFLHITPSRGYEFSITHFLTYKINAK
jgi:hypothetical protein